MSSTNKILPNWREDHSIRKSIKYKKRYAWFPRKLTDGNWVFLKDYYQRNVMWYASYAKDQFHTDKAEFIDEREYITQILLDNV